jgi:hypothetical protein
MVFSRDHLSLLNNNLMVNEVIDEGEAWIHTDEILPEEESSNVCSKYSYCYRLDLVRKMKMKMMIQITSQSLFCTERVGILSEITS